MKKLLVIKNNIIVILCLTILVLSIGFVLVSVKMERLNNTDDIFDVRFTKVRQITSIKGGIVEPESKLKISKNGKILNFSYNMNTEHDEIDYEVIVTNNGTIPAVIDEIIMSPDYTDTEVASSIKPLVVNVSDISGKLLDPGEEATIKFSVIYNSDVVSGNKSIAGKIGIIAESIR